jgi:hypothetical protein
MIAIVLFANSNEYSDDLANLLAVVSYENLSKFKRDGELIDFLRWIGQEAWCARARAELTIAHCLVKLRGGGNHEAANSSTAQ